MHDLIKKKILFCGSVAFDPIPFFKTRVDRAFVSSSMPTNDAFIPNFWAVENMNKPPHPTHPTPLKEEREMKTGKNAHTLTHKEGKTTTTGKPTPPSSPFPFSSDVNMNKSITN